MKPFAAELARRGLLGSRRGHERDGGTGFDLGNIGRGIGERAGDLGGGLLGAVNAAAGYLERQIPLGGIDLERGVYGPDAPPERNLGHVAARRLKDLDLGYAPGTTWAEVKRSPASKVIAFAVEQGLVSAPDMAAALASLPAYVLARTGELAGEGPRPTCARTRRWGTWWRPCRGRRRRRCWSGSARAESWGSAMR